MIRFQVRYCRQTWCLHALAWWIWLRVRERAGAHIVLAGGTSQHAGVQSGTGLSRLHRGECLPTLCAIFQAVSSRLPQEKSAGCGSRRLAGRQDLLAFFSPLADILVPHSRGSRERIRICRVRREAAGDGGYGIVLTGLFNEKGLHDSDSEYNTSSGPFTHCLRASPQAGSRDANRRAAASAPCDYRVLLAVDGSLRVGEPGWR